MVPRLRRPQIANARVCLIGLAVLVTSCSDAEPEPASARSVAHTTALHAKMPAGTDEEVGFALFMSEGLTLVDIGAVRFVVPLPETPMRMGVATGSITLSTGLGRGETVHLNGIVFAWHGQDDHISGQVGALDFRLDRDGMLSAGAETLSVLGRPRTAVVVGADGSVEDRFVVEW